MQENKNGKTKDSKTKNKALAKKYRLLQVDPWLEPFSGDIKLRMDNYERTREKLVGKNGSLSDFANAHNYYGFHKVDTGWVYREWAPAAEALYLIGDFNGWNRGAHPLNRINGTGDWEIFIEGRGSLPHESKVKVHVVAGGRGMDRLPLFVRKVVQNKESHDFSGQIWAPEQEFTWTDGGFSTSPIAKENAAAPLIYETHVGMAQEKEAIGTYREFEEITLPRIKALGYNTVQIMAIMEHPYYASFGYHVSSFFAASSWFGTPSELKSLINTAHSMGLTVLMDIVQSHAVKNLSEGINEFDGTEYQFFHSGPKGTHSAWDSKLFNYSKPDVIHFLLSNVKFWMEEYHFDGFRFDGVTSMIYWDHGLGTAFDNYGKYFSLNTDIDALTYLQLANELIKELNPNAVSIAEDMSGMPGMCLPVKDGGIGFDYRLAMGMPDYWAKTAKLSDEDWNMNGMVHELSTTRPAEKRIGYVESHDQALVGDKTFIFRLADKEMYWHMNKGSKSLIIDRAIALHKMARLITLSMGSEGYLTFMGNEFGHPEWIDFPREGNGWSFKYCRRQWSLADDEALRYSDLNRFDKEMLAFLKGNGLHGGHPQILYVSDDKKIIAFKKTCNMGGTKKSEKQMIFIFNFHPTASYEKLEIPVHTQNTLRTVFSTDNFNFGGFGRVYIDVDYQPKRDPKTGDDMLTIYAPSRTATVLEVSS